MSTLIALKPSSEAQPHARPMSQTDQGADLMVPVFFVSVQRVLAGDREKVETAVAGEAQGVPTPAQKSAKGR